MWYNIDISKLVTLLTPTFLRTEKMLAWLQTLHFPIDRVLDNFRTARTDNIYKLTHNGQVCYLRKVLNDRFDISQRRIDITEGNRYKRQYIYTKAEQKPVYLNTKNQNAKLYIRQSYDYADTGLDFIVLVPEKLIYNHHEMTALVDFYKLTSKKYKIVDS